MGTIAGALRKILLGISPRETSFARRGFPDQPAPARDRLEYVGRTFVHGYNLALTAGSPTELEANLKSLELEVQGFGFEGAAMGLALLDLLASWRRDRWAEFVRGPGEPHIYMVHVGVGFALARLRRRVEPALARMDPILGWLVLDGYGFHEGFFHWKRSFKEHQVPNRLPGYSRRVFDQGLGRSLWFVEGGDVERVAARVDTFPEARHADLWAGIGLACTYAGGVSKEEVETLRASAKELAPELAQGAAFAAKARERAGNPADHTRLACAVLCEMSAEEAAQLTDTTLESLPPDSSEPAYEVWRRQVRRHFEAAVGV